MGSYVEAAVAARVVKASKGDARPKETETGGSSQPATERGNDGVKCGFEDCASTDGINGGCGIWYKPSAELGGGIDVVLLGHLTVGGWLTVDSLANKKRSEGGTRG